MLRDPYIEDSWLGRDSPVMVRSPPAPAPFPEPCVPRREPTNPGVVVMIDHDAMPKKKRGGTRIDIPFEALPISLRDALEPHLEQTRDGRFVNVSPQPGGGSGYQVQFWLGKPRGHVRLATVLDPKVGALLVAAARADPSLLRAPLVARAWLLQLIEREDHAEEWVRCHL